MSIISTNHVEDVPANRIHHDVLTGREATPDQHGTPAKSEVKTRAFFFFSRIGYPQQNE